MRSFQLFAAFGIVFTLWSVNAPRNDDAPYYPPGVKKPRIRRDVSMDQCMMHLIHFVSPTFDPANQQSPLISTNFSRDGPLLEWHWPFFGDPLRNVLRRRPQRTLQQWQAFREDDEHSFLDFKDTAAYCYSTTDGSPDESAKWETLYAVCDRRFLPHRLNETTFSQFVRCVIYWGISESGKGRQSRGVEHIAEGTSHQLARDLHIRAVNRAQVGRSIDAIWRDGGSVLVMTIPNIREELSKNMESMCIASFATDYTVNTIQQLANEKLDATEMVKALPEGSQKQSAEKRKDEYRGVKIAWRFYQKFLEQVQ